MNPQEQEQTRKRIELAAKILGFGIVGFLVAPFVFLAIKGIVGLAIASIITILTINFIPYFGSVVSNWKLKAIKAEAAKNPVETLQNEYKKRCIDLGNFRKTIIDYKSGVDEFQRKLKDIIKSYPDEAKTFQEQYDKMIQLYNLRSRNYEEASKKLKEFEQEIKKASAIWDMAQAAIKMQKLSGFDDEAFMRKIQTETAIDSVQQSLSASFAELELSLAEEKSESATQKDLTNRQAVSTSNVSHQKQLIS